MAPDENTWKVFDYAWAAIGGLIMLVWQMLNGRIDHNFKNLSKRIDDSDAETDKNRQTIAKLFDKLEEHSRASTDRHIELLQYLRDKR